MYCTTCMRVEDSWKNKHYSINGNIQKSTFAIIFWFPPNITLEVAKCTFTKGTPSKSR